MQEPRTGSIIAFTTCAGERGGCGQCGGGDLVDHGEVVLGQRLEQGALARKELIEQADGRSGAVAMAMALVVASE